MLERRLAMVPPFQLRTFGATPTEIKRNFLERVLVREALLAQGGAERGSPSAKTCRSARAAVLRNAYVSPA